MNHDTPKRDPAGAAQRLKVESDAHVIKCMGDVDMGLVEGEGVRVRDADGNEYLDAISAERTAARAAGDASPRVGRSLNWCDAKCSRLISVFSRQQEEDDLDDGHGGAGGGNQSDDGSGRGEDGDGQTRN